MASLSPGKGLAARELSPSDYRYAWRLNPIGRLTADNWGLSKADALYARELVDVVARDAPSR